MPISRFLFFSPKHRFRQPLNLLQRFDPSKRVQSGGYTKSSRHNHGLDGNRVMPVETKASHSWSTYVIPGALLGFAGLATIVHYNDERRAIPKVKDIHQSWS